MTTLAYGYEKDLGARRFEDAIIRVTEALKEEGFGILTEIDVKGVLKEKLDVDCGRYTILGACNPSLAWQAIQAEPQVGLLLPCNVVVQETAGRVIVSIADPKAMFSLIENPALEPVVEEADLRLGRVLDALG